MSGNSSSTTLSEAALNFGRRRAGHGFMALILVTIAFLAAFLYLDYRRTMQEAHLHLLHVGELFNETFLSSLEIASLETRAVVAALSQAALTEADPIDSAFGPLLHATVERVEQIDSLVLIGPEGRVLWATREQLLGLDLSDRGYFQKAQAAAAGEYVLGVPIISRGTGRRVTPIAWPVIAPDAAPGDQPSVIASSLGEGYFSELLSDTEYEADMVLEIRSIAGPVAFASHEFVQEDRQRMVEASVPIAGSDLETAIARPRAALMKGFLVRAVTFSSISTVLFAIALAAAYSARQKSEALQRSLAQTRAESRRTQLERNRFQAIFQNVDDGIIVFSAQGHFRTSNRRARELLGARSEEAAVERFRASLPFRIEDLNERTTFHLPVARSGTGEHSEIRCKVSRVDENEGQTLYCVLNDISGEERLVRARSKFIETVNHELRTPLTSLSGSLALVTNRFGDGIEPKARKLLDLATRNASRLLMLVNDILTLQAVDEGRLDFTPSLLRADSVVSDALATMQGYANGFEVLLEDGSDGTAGAFEADGRRVQQVLGNLISNAIKYSPRGATVTVAAKATPGGGVSIGITDCGPGIPEEAHDAIFERFAKPAHDTDVQVPGTGLGLAISRELVQRQGGSMTFETVHTGDPGGAERHGTTFWVTFPLAGAAGAESGARQLGTEARCR